MTALHPLLLWLLPAALALPLLAHLWLRLRTRPLVLPSVMFFLKIDPAMQARRRLREYLLLLLRVLFLALALLALARPISEGWGAKTRRSAVVVVDTSASMARPAAQGNASALERAVLCAHAIVDGLGEGDAAAVLTTAPDPELAGRLGTLADPAVLHQLLDELDTTDAAGALAPVLHRAGSLLRGAGTPERELHLITDLQANEWAREPTETFELDGVRVVVHRIAVAPAHGTATTVSAPEPASGRILAGRPHPFEVALRGAPGTSVELALRSSDGDDDLHRVTLNELGEGSLPVDTVPPDPGLHWLKVTLTDAAGSGAATAAYRALPRQWVEMRADAPLLELALAPAGDGRLSGLVPRREDPGAAVAGEPAAVVAEFAALTDDASPLHAWIAAGGTALLYPGLSGTAALERYGMDIEPSRAVDRRTAVLAADDAAACLPAMADEAGAVAVPGWELARFRPLRGGAEWRSLFTTDDGIPVVMERDVGQGRIAVLGFAFDTGWTNLPLQGYALALVQGLVLGPRQDQRAIQQLIAGARPAASASTTLLRLDALAGGRLSWRGLADQLPPLVRTGVYRLDDGHDPVLIAVNPDPAEREATAVDDILALRGIDVRELAFDRPHETRERLADLRSGGELAAPLALLALLVLALECWVGSWRGIAPDRAADARRGEFGTVLGTATASPAMILWHPAIRPGPSAAIAVAVALGAWWLWVRLRERGRPLQVALLILPKVLVAALLFLLVADPYLRRETTEAADGELVALVDHSSSMDVADDGHRSRLARAWDRVERLRSELPPGISLRVHPVERSIGDALTAAPTERGGVIPGDLTTALGDLSERSEGARAAILFTDGGDESPRLVADPELPLHVIGIGASAEAWTDLAVADADAPPSVERGAPFTINAELRARRGELGEDAVAALRAVVEHRGDDGSWQLREEREVDLRSGRARLAIELSEEQVGRHRYRVRLAELEGELTTANNQRELGLDVTADRLQVLYLGERIGLGYKQLRAALVRDPGIGFSALLRTRGNRYQLVGDATPEAFGAGVPTDPGALADFDVLILGASDESSWSPQAQAAVAERVRAGAALVWFDAGAAHGGDAYRSSALDAIRPWQVGPAVEARRGSYRLAVPSGAAGHPMLDGVGEELRDAELASLSTGLNVRPDAELLVEASAGDRAQPIIAARRVGDGQVLGIASDTLWQLATADAERRAAYGRFWRQAMRVLVGRDQELGRLRIRWDRERYRPGDQGQLTIQLVERRPGAAPQLSAMLTAPEADAQQPLVVRPAAVGDGWELDVPFDRAGEHRVALALQLPDGEEVQETAVDVAPRLAEGARLELDHDALDRLALAGNGRYIREDDPTAWRQLVEQLTAADVIRSDHPLVGGRWWTFVLICLLLIAEWGQRRRMGLP